MPGQSIPTVLMLLGALVSIAIALGVIVLAVRSTIARTYPQAAVVAFLIVLAFAQLTGDLLSLAQVFARGPLLIVWCLGLTAAGITVWLRRSHLARPDYSTIRPERWTWLVIALVMGATALSGLLIAPTNYDSQTYHLPRALHWLQQGSLDFFITPNTRENINAPLPSLLHALMLSIDDRAHLVFLAQWLSALVAMIGAGVAARAFFARSRPAFAALFVLATPLVVVMASTTQADLLVLVPLAGAAVAFAMLLADRTRAAIAVLALSVGLAMAIKLTAIIVIIPVAIAFLIMLLRRRGWRPALLLVVATGIAVLILNAAYIVKVGVIGGSSMDMASAVVNARFTPGITVGNLVKNTVTVFQVPNAGVAAGLTGAVTSALQPLGIDPFDPDATFPFYTPRFEIWSEWSDGTLGGPLQVLIGLAATVILLIRSDRSLRRRIGCWLLIVGGQFLLIATILRWQPWNSRFLLPVVLMLAPVAAAAAARVWPWLRGTTSVLLAATAVGLVLVAPGRGLLGTEWVPEVVLRHTTIPRGGPLYLQDRFTQMGLGSTDAQSLSSLGTAIDDALARRPDVLAIGVGMNDYREYLIWYRARGVDPQVRILHDTDALVGTSAGRVVWLCLAQCTPPATARVFGPSAAPIYVWQGS